MYFIVFCILFNIAFILLSFLFYHYYYALLLLIYYALLFIVFYCILYVGSLTGHRLSAGLGPLHHVAHREVVHLLEAGGHWWPSDPKAGEQ